MTPPRDQETEVDLVGSETKGSVCNGMHITLSKCLGHFWPFFYYVAKCTVFSPVAPFTMFHSYTPRFSSTSMNYILVNAVGNV